jgi:hypothetical protein
MQSDEQKSELREVFESYTKDWKSLDYVAGWFYKAALFGSTSKARAAFVATNSICQGEQVPILWPLIFATGNKIDFAVRSFKWRNLASHNAGVTVVIVGMTKEPLVKKRLYDVADDGNVISRLVDNIGPYLIPSSDMSVSAMSSANDSRGKMIRGNMANDGGHLILTKDDAEALRRSHPGANKFVRKFVGSQEFIQSKLKYCIWIEDKDLNEVMSIPAIVERIKSCREARLGGGKQARDNANTPHRFVFAPHKAGKAIIVPRVSSENRPYLPVGLTDGFQIVSERNFVLYDAPTWNLAVIASRMHWVWIGTVCVRMRTDFSYSNTLGWNTFPMPTLTAQNKASC